MRVTSHPGYPNPLKVGAIMERLGEAIATAQHELWEVDVGLLDPRIADRSRIHGPRPVTDLYLLAIAVRRGGCFVSVEPSIPRTAIKGAEKKHLVTFSSSDRHTSRDRQSGTTDGTDAVNTGGAGRFAAEPGAKTWRRPGVAALGGERAASWQREGRMDDARRELERARDLYRDMGAGPNAERMAAQIE